MMSHSVNKHGRHRQFIFLIAQLKKYSPLKLLAQNNQNFLRIIYGMFSIKIANFVRIRFANVAATGKFCL
jgi:hypothetical protein